MVDEAEKQPEPVKSGKTFGSKQKDNEDRMFQVLDCMTRSEETMQSYRREFLKDQISK